MDGVCQGRHDAAGSELPRPCLTNDLPSALAVAVREVVGHSTSCPALMSARGMMDVLQDPGNSVGASGVRCPGIDSISP